MNEVRIHFGVRNCRITSFYGLDRWLIALCLVVNLTATYSMAADVATTHPAANPDYYVSTDGNDSNTGSSDAPLATIARARDLVRQRIAAGLNRDVLVRIRGGNYELSETLSFDFRDSGSAEHSITYGAGPGEKVILSGGRKISGWKKGANEIWTADVPEVKAGKGYFRELFINGVRALRARTPNSDSPEAWCKMLASSVNYEDETSPVTIKLGGVHQPFHLQAYQNPEDVELVYINNNDEGRKLLGSVDEADQTFTLAPPHRWNSKDHPYDWYLSFPDTHWKACYLENAIEMLDEPGEWYLNRHTGVLSYWPRAGEDLTHAEVIAPVVQNTLIRVAGTRENPVVNLHFNGIHVEHVNWPLPAYGYMGLFCCTVDTGPRDHLQHGFIDAAVEYQYARSCSFTNGRISHVGAMGICLRQGTAEITIDGNEIGDIGAGGIGASEIRQKPIGQRPWNPFPRAGDYRGYRFTNNLIHDCGTDYYGGAGITLFMAQDSTISHNLIHDISYSGIQWAGDVENQAAFTRNNKVEFNHIYRAMKVTCDGAGIYVTYTHAGDTLIRGNLIHDILCNPFRRDDTEPGHGVIPCHGLYLDGNMHSGEFEDNLVYRNAGGPLLVFQSSSTNNTWRDNLFQKEGAPPEPFIEVMQAASGLEPAYQGSLLGQEPNPCQVTDLIDAGTAVGITARQFDLPVKGRGVIEIIRQPGAKVESIRLLPRGLEAGSHYSITAFGGALAKAASDFFVAYGIDPAFVKNLGDIPILSNVAPQPLSDLGFKIRENERALSGGDLMTQGLTIVPTDQHIVWLTYTRVAPGP